ncbi:MAG: UDP-N-acetylenolpyruvoylglucosamine reductase [Candidatus Sumerlaea sp.]|uniref:UDP-N-acetylenolpyruvoylglucosamine reductase n=1 Tax=Sumerlaea chitinivorans TaxID=2250252 RepID=A0A2Z4Y7A2_SUMC1|nr:UDP-N-acetylenolpyruvoylglucosamine reductase [Candidatus Sumerlaea chitinivorans]GIX45025.1 MAG: UDP-N-acetylenolpyruvoylglucosamine reductase [Candidatus Sumerlaea sp.]
MLSDGGLSCASVFSAKQAKEPPHPPQVLSLAGIRKNEIDRSHSLVAPSCLTFKCEFRIHKFVDPQKTDIPTEDRIIHDHPLQANTTLGVGGPARYYLPVTTVGQLKGAVDWARQQGIPFVVLAGGSNVVIADDGVEGLVVHLQIKGREVHIQGEDVFLRVQAGEHWDYVVEYAVANGWAGIECLSGIPGSVGATPIQNVGAYGQQVSDTIATVEVLDLFTKKIVSFSNSDCGFGYRTSRFRTTDWGRYVVTSVTYRLQKDGRPIVRYPELAQFLQDRRFEHPTLAQVRGAVRTLRQRKAMLYDPNEVNSHSCGSFFVNPVLSQSEYEQFLERARQANLLGPQETPPTFALESGDYKISAAWLIERAGFRRGSRLGRAGISERHALALINLGGAKSRDIIALAQLIQTQVHDKFGIELHPEPIFIGFAQPPLAGAKCLP